MRRRKMYVELFVIKRKFTRLVHRNAFPHRRPRPQRLPLNPPFSPRPPLQRLRRNSMNEPILARVPRRIRRDGAIRLIKLLDG